MHIEDQLYHGTMYIVYITYIQFPIKFVKTVDRMKYLPLKDRKKNKMHTHTNEKSNTQLVVTE